MAKGTQSETKNLGSFHHSLIDKLFLLISHAMRGFHAWADLDVSSYTHEWPRQNFSLQNKYNFRQTSDENKEKHQLSVY